MSASKCKYFNSCPSASGWCVDDNEPSVECIPFILCAYKNATEKPQAEATKKVINTGGGSEFRPCYVVDAEAYSCNVPVMRYERKALFHRWAEKAKLIIKQKRLGQLGWKAVEEAVKMFNERGILPECCDLEKALQTVAIVEYEDGTVEEVEPTAVRFVPGIISEYDFGEGAENETRNDADSKE